MKPAHYLFVWKRKWYRLTKRHDYYYQVQCQLYCDDKTWCDSVVRTNKELYVERVWRDAKWGTPSLQSSSHLTLITYYRNSHAPDTTREAFMTKTERGWRHASDKCNGTSIPVSSFFILFINAFHPPNYLISWNGN